MTLASLNDVIIESIGKPIWIPFYQYGSTLSMLVLKLIYVS